MHALLRMADEPVALSLQRPFDVWRLAHAMGAGELRKSLPRLEVRMSLRTMDAMVLGALVYPKLREFALSQQSYTSYLFALRAPALHTLELVGLDMRDPVLQMHVDAHRLPALKRICLAQNILGDETVTYLSIEFRLTHVDLSYNCITDLGLRRALRDFAPGLQQLSLAYNILLTARAVREARVPVGLALDTRPLGAQAYPVGA